MLPHFPAGAGTQEIGSKRKEKRGKEEFLKGKCNQACCWDDKKNMLLGQHVKHKKKGSKRRR